MCCLQFLLYVVCCINNVVAVDLVPKNPEAAKGTPRIEIKSFERGYHGLFPRNEIIETKYSCMFSK
jgi:hypothetical protein